MKAKGMLVSKRVWHKSQSFWYEETRRRRARPSALASFRATIKRNAYDEQSHGKVEMWTATGWQEVVRYDVSYLDAKHVNAHVKSSSGRFEELASHDVSRMFEEAFTITGYGE